MIDEKKLNEEAEYYAKSVFRYYEAAHACKLGFIAGAEWAQKEFGNSLWHDARKYKPTDIEGYKEDLLALMIEYPTHHEFDIVIGWYDTVHSKFIIPERFPNYRRYIIKAFLVLPKFNKEGGEQ